jgi:multimeric flavodoxin WrbA
MEVTNDGGAPIVTAASLGGGQQNINSEIASWVSAAPTTGDLIDTTGTATYSVTNGVLQSGAVIAGSNYSNSVGSSLGFYNIVSTGRSSVSINQYKNSAGAGYWFLSNTGDLTYNIAAAAAPVPLPAAVWLLGSGLLGMAGIARRRSVA